MGFLNIFSKTETPTLSRLVSGSFTIDAKGQILASTLPHSFSESLVKEIGQVVLNAFRDAQKAETPLSELIIYYSAMRITARELRGGAMVFLAPKNLKIPTVTK